MSTAIPKLYILVSIGFSLRSLTWTKWSVLCRRDILKTSLWPESRIKTRGVFFFKSTHKVWKHVQIINIHCLHNYFYVIHKLFSWVIRNVAKILEIWFLHTDWRRSEMIYSWLANRWCKLQTNRFKVNKDLGGFFKDSF